MIDILEETGVIDGITMKKTAKGKDMYVVSINERNYYAFDFVPAFKLLDEKKVEIGREITAKYVFSESYIHKGKETKSRHLKNLVNVEIEEKPTPKSVVVPKVEHINVNEEPKKEPIKPVEPVKKNLCGATSLQQLYIVRQSSLKAAIEFVNILAVLEKEKAEDEVLRIAEKMEKWVLR